LFTKELAVAIGLWFTAAIGIGGNSLAESREERQEARPTNSYVYRVIESPQKAQQDKNSLLTASFLFNERSQRVGQLQSVLGVLVDEHYGAATRAAHLKALEQAGLETAFLPALPNPIKDGNKRRYNISEDPTHRCPQFEPLFAQYGLEPVEVFSYIAYRESRCTPEAVNAKFDSKGNVTWTLNKDGSIDRGLIQINSCWKTVTKNVCGTGLEGLFDVHCNLKVAKYIMDNSASGLGNWNVWDK
jgi:hypothetical protein